ncbi:hypothetical protein [Planomonospora parontospora]|uniref:hypothetical protein n=1 Tax=Planomonospora parontospora TaxID=58119 RepID=UPI00166FF62F|nr:hypothetical protein [Planomonospora parontospora]GGL49930.1 hypothetical protein GCM10014719_58960 [Planomonospora parontospora subsp. antibiotica]GII19332.1 hypothetical protein Ppa05_60580 [Planomonospora parontospora subsp. antibiotica]
MARRHGTKGGGGAVVGGGGSKPGERRRQPSRELPAVPRINASFRDERDFPILKDFKEIAAQRNISEAELLRIAIRELVERQRPTACGSEPCSESTAGAIPGKKKEMPIAS